MKSKPTLSLIVILVFLIALLPGGQPTRAANVSVTTTLDINDGDTSSIDNLIANPGHDGEISLREAIIATNNTTGSDTISFDLTDDDPHYNEITRVWSILPTNALPVLTGGGTSIDGYTQEGASEATADSPATLVVKIDGDNVLANNGINITSAENLIRGLVINNFPYNGIAIGAATAVSNTISGNYIGVTITPGGLSDKGNAFAGVFIGLGAQNNLVGGDTPADRNIISGNEFEGVNIHGENTAGNIISGNYIGTNESGTAGIGNTLDGVRVYGGAHDNLVGGPSPASGNLISGNHRDGVRITGNNTMTNTVSANYIGLNAAGTSVLQNWEAGVIIQDGAHNNLIGGDTQGERNIIVGSSAGRMCSLGIFDSGTNNNVVKGNYIGTDESGMVGLRYDVDIYGIRISDGAQNNTIGPSNLISGHSYNGVYISGNETTNNTIVGNYIGTNADGDSALGNQIDGIRIEYASNNTIGGTASGDRNVISGNDGRGIYVLLADNVTIINNHIGTSANGTASLPNGASGIRVSDSLDTIIGGDSPEERNVISGNESSGVIIANSISSVVSGNYIGLAASGSDALGNGEHGVYLIDNSVVVTIGPGNSIAYNDEDGVHINGNLTTNNTITQNSIFQNNDLGIELSDDGNYNLTAPNITAGSCEGLVSGTACEWCTVEIFSDGLNQGRYYEGTTTADATTGAFSWSGSMNGPNLTATATDPDDNTSPFSTPFEVGVCNYAPTAYFTIDPLTGQLSTAFSFDASGSTDTEDDTVNLEVRWDWTDDGIYDTDWDVSKTILHTYSKTDTHTVRLEVRDTGGLMDTTIRQVIVVDNWQLYLPYIQK